MRPKHQGSSHFADNTGDPFYGLVYALVFIFDGTVIFWRVSGIRGLKNCKSVTAKPLETDFLARLNASFLLTFLVTGKLAPKW